MLMYKLMTIGRHAQAPQKPEGGSFDRLKEGQIAEVYKDAAVVTNRLIRTYIPGTRRKVLLRPTDKVRTVQTGLARIAGGLGLGPYDAENPPQTPDQVREVVLPDHAIVLPGFNLTSPDVNMEIYKDPARGPATNVNYWLQNPTADQHEGVEIAQGAAVKARARQFARDTLTLLLRGTQGPPKIEYDWGVAINHATQCSMLTLALVDPDNEITDVADIGGTYSMGEAANIAIRLTGSGDIAEATFSRRGLERKIDLDKVLN